MIYSLMSFIETIYSGSAPLEREPSGAVDILPPSFRERVAGLVKENALKVAALGCAGLVAMGIVPEVAGADQVTHPALISAERSKTTPVVERRVEIVDGKPKDTAAALAVEEVTVDGKPKICIGGDFDSARQFNGAPESHPNLFCYEALSGIIDNRVKDPGGVVEVIVKDSGSSMIVGGQSPLGLKKIDAATGNEIPEFKVEVGGRPEGHIPIVRDAAIWRDIVVLTGQFLDVDGAPHSGIAAVNKNTGQLVPGFDLQLLEKWSAGLPGENRSVYGYDVAINQYGIMAVLCNCKTVGTVEGPQHREQLLLYDLNINKLLGWETMRLADRCNEVPGGRYLEFDETGDWLYLAVNGWKGQPGGLCDSASGWKISQNGQVILGPDKREEWKVCTAGDSVFTVKYLGRVATQTGPRRVVAMGGHFRKLGGSEMCGLGSIAEAEAMGTVHEEMALVDADTGAVIEQWNPGHISHGRGFTNAEVTDRALIMVGDKGGKVWAFTHSGINAAG